MLLVAPDPGTPVIAIYGAVTGTVAILVSGVSVWWNIHRDRSARRIRVDVSLRAGIAGSPDGSSNGAVELLIVKAVNRSGFAVTISGAGLRLPDGQQFVITRPFLSTLPAELDAHTGSADIMVQLRSVRSVVPGFNFTEKQQAYVILKSGETFTSRHTPLGAQH